MPHPLPSSHRQRRQRNIGLRLVDLFELLSDDTIRRSRTVPPAVAGPWRRTLAEAAGLLGPCVEPPAGSLRPSDFFVSTLSKVHALVRLNRLHDKGVRRKLKQAYPRGAKPE